MSAPARPGFELKGWHVLVGVVGFFGAVIAVDVAMAVKAYQTFPGEVSATPYEEGLSFNHTLAERAQARSLGWRAKVSASVAGAGSQVRSGRVLLSVSMLDGAGEPLRRLAMTGRLERPATEAGRIALDFTETRPGIYQAVAPDTPGAWTLTLAARDPAGRSFDAESRFLWR